jgi:hypothetical protein
MAASFRNDVGMENELPWSASSPIKVRDARTAPGKITNSKTQITNKIQIRNYKSEGIQSITTRIFDNLVIGICFGFDAWDV